MCALSNCYLRYEKTENAKYVSHLDFVRMFGRAIRRAHIPIAYSEGFNPHPILGFALPLSVGYTSECEILELALSEDVKPDVVMEKLNAVLPEGVRITAAFPGKSRMKKLRYALYIVYPDNMPESIDEFLLLKEIFIEKKTKSGIKETDIRPDIKDIKIKDDRIEMVLSAGSMANLKPEVVINAINKYIDGTEIGDCEYHRKEIYAEDMSII